MKATSRQADGEANGELASLMQTLGGPEDGTQKSTIKFNKGDAVIVVEGDLKSLLGRVVNVADDGKVYMQPQIKDLQVLPFEPHQLSKHFKVPLLHALLFSQPLRHCSFLPRPHVSLPYTIVFSLAIPCNVPLLVRLSYELMFEAPRNASEQS